VRLAALFALATCLAVAVVGGVVYQRQKRFLEDTVGAQLLNIARVAGLMVDPAAHMQARRAGTVDSPAYQRIRRALNAVRNETLLTTPVYTITAFDRTTRRAKLVVTSDADRPPGETITVPPEVAQMLGWTFDDSVARYTGIYGTPRTGMWISAFAAVGEPGNSTSTPAVLVVNYSVDVYLDRLAELRNTVIQASLAGGAGALLLGLLFAGTVTRPIRALTHGVARVAGGDLSRPLAVRSRDELGQLTTAFNSMLEGLRQRDFIKHAFGRYVSPEVAQTLLESPEGLRFGGEKRLVSILMSDLRGYTRFAEQGDPQWVMDVLNGYLARMADVIIAHGGTINEFIGDAIFAVFGAPLPHDDHAERAAAAALAMQRAMIDINAEHAGRRLPRFQMGIGVNTGEAVVGNIGSEQRAKYAVVGSAVNVAARVESATIGGQIYITAATYERVQALADVGPLMEIAVKGVAEPLRLFELHALRGRFAQTLPPVEDERFVAAALPLTCWTIEGQTVSRDSVVGTVARLSAYAMDARLAQPLATLTNVRLRLTWTDGKSSGELYGKVIGGEGSLTRIRLTSVDPADRQRLETLVAISA